MSGAGLSPAVRGTTSYALYSQVDWLPTIVGGIAGVDLAQALVPNHAYQPAPPPLDGYDLWASLSTGSPSPRTELLLGLSNVVCWGDAPCDVPGTGAIRVGDYKLIRGHAGVWNVKGNVSMNFCGNRDNDVQPNTYPLHVTVETSPPFCPTGWVPQPGSGESVVPPPDVPACFDAGGAPSLPCSTDGSAYLSGGTWLFDVVADPTEKINLAPTRPDLVAALLAKLQAYNDTNIPQANSPQDPAADPSKFGGFWTPWRGDAVPAHCDPNTTAPPTPGAGLRSNFDDVTFHPSGGVGAAPAFAAVAVTASGWAWDAESPDGGRAQLNITVQVDGADVGSCIAGFPRPGLVPKTGAPDPDHGFVFNATVPVGLTTGRHTWGVSAWVNGTRVPLVHSPQCYCDMAPCGCK